MLVENYGIYRITNTVTGEFYIGASRRIKTRIYQHFHSLQKKEHQNKKFQRSYDQHGRVAFSWEVLELIPRDVHDHENLTVRAAWMAHKECEYMRKRGVKLNQTRMIYFKWVSVEHYLAQLERANLLSEIGVKKANREALNVQENKQAYGACRQAEPQAEVRGRPADSAGQISCCPGA